MESRRKADILMAKKQKVSSREQSCRPAATPEARENQMVSLAVDLAEKQLREGTASSQVIVHYLKLGTRKEKLEQEMLEKKTELVTAQAEAVRSAKKVEELYSEAMEAMRKYSGSGDYGDDYDY